MSRSLFPGKLKKGYLIKSPPLDGGALTKIFKCEHAVSLPHAQCVGFDQLGPSYFNYWPLAGKTNQQGWKRRWCVLYLSDGRLYFQYYENEEKSHTGCPKNTLLLEDCIEITFDLEHPEYDNVFSIMLPERTYYFSAISSVEMVDWVDKIREPLDLKRATSLKVQKSVRRSATLDTSSPYTSSPLPVPPSLFFPGGNQTLQTPTSPGGLTITPPLPPRNSPTNPYNGVAGFCTLPRQQATKSMSLGPEGPPLPIRNKLRDQNDSLPPLPPPHSSAKRRVSANMDERLVFETPGMMRTSAIETRDEKSVCHLPHKPHKTSTAETSDEQSAPPIPPRLPSSSSENSDVKSTTEPSDEGIVPPLPPKPLVLNDVKPPVVPPRKISCTTDYVNYDIMSAPDKRPVPAPRTRKPIEN